MIKKVSVNFINESTLKDYQKTIDNLALINGTWKIPILYALYETKLTTIEIQRTLPEIDEIDLGLILQALENDCLIEKTRIEAKSIYSLTEKGLHLHKVLKALSEWHFYNDIYSGTKAIVKIDTKPLLPSVMEKEPIPSDDSINNSDINNNENTENTNQPDNDSKENKEPLPSVNEGKSILASLFRIEKSENIKNQLKKSGLQFRNGKVNEEYSEVFDSHILDSYDINDYWFEGLEDINLNYNNQTQEIKGTPNKSGNFKVSLKYRLHNEKEDGNVHEYKIPIIINPDPRSLWNNIPTSPDIEYYRPDFDCKFINLPGQDQKNIVAASLRGRSHAHIGSARDDDFSISYQENGSWYITVVADGAGSVEYSREGAHIACTTVSEVCNTMFSKYNNEIDELIKSFQRDSTDIKRKKLGDILYNVIGSAVFKAYKDIEKEALEKDVPIKEYSTTLLVSISKKFDFGWFIASFWVGDGGIAIYNKDTQYIKIMGESDGGEFAGQTRFLTMGEIMQSTEIYRRLRFEIVEDFTAIVLMTDGVTDPKFETDSNLMKIEKWNDFWNDLSTSVNFSKENKDIENQLLKWLEFWSPGNHDDRTIAIIY